MGLVITVWGLCVLHLQKRREERAKQHQWQSDRMQYGKTEGGKYVDQQSLEQLVSLGYELPLAAEALRQVGSRCFYCRPSSPWFGRPQESQCGC